MHTHHLSLVDTLKHQLATHASELAAIISRAAELLPEADAYALQRELAAVERTFGSLDNVLMFYSHVPDAVTPETVASALGVTLPSAQPSAAERAEAVTPAELGLKEPADVLSAIGRLEREDDVYALVRGWAKEGNRAALQTVVEHCSHAPLAEFAKRQLLKLEPQTG